MHNMKVTDVMFQLTQAIKYRQLQHLNTENIGVTPMHVRVMKIIHRRSPCTAQDIARLVQRDKAQITRLIKGLIDQGFVQRKPNLDDKRSQLLDLTEKGLKIQDRLLVFAEETQETITQGIDEKDLASFIKIAQIMTKNMSDDRK